MNAFTPSDNIDSLTKQARALFSIVKSKESEIARLNALLQEANNKLDLTDNQAVNQERQTNQQLTNALLNAESRLSNVLNKFEPNSKDIADLKLALTRLGFSSPASDEELANKWLSFIRKILRRVI